MNESPPDARVGPAQSAVRLVRGAWGATLAGVERVLRPPVMQALLTWERLESGVSYNPVSAKVRENPYATYEQLRRIDPVHRMRLVDAWVLVQYADVNMMLRDQRRFSNVDRDSGYTDYVSMLDMDPPDHTRLRSLVVKAFTPRAVAQLEPRIQETCDDLLDDVAGKTRFDLIQSLAFPLPVIIIAEMLGVPPEDRERFKTWSQDAALSIEPTLERPQIRRVVLAFENLRAYFRDLIEQRRRDPQDDMISALLAAEEAGDKLNREELLMTLMLLLVAGHETTRNLIGNGMLALLRHPDQLQRLRDQPDLMDSAIHEMLRYESPVQMDGRVVREDVTIGGKSFRKGQRIIALVGAANRDPAAFSRPDVLDIGRQDTNHIAFGRGIHYCLGSSLALLEGRIAFANLLRRFPSIQLADEPEFSEHIVLRGVKELWVDVGRAAA